MSTFMEIINETTDQDFSCVPVEEDDISPQEARRARKRYLYGKFWGTKVDVHSGVLRSIPFLCGDILCDNCRKIKVDELKNRLARAIMDGLDIVMEEFDVDEATEVVGEIGKERCLRIPGDDFDVVFHTVQRYNEGE